MILLLLGCLPVTDGAPLPLGDQARFVSEAQPVLAGCANPACHGSADRPLEVYAVHLHRMDPADTWRDLPLTPEELFWNQVRASAFLWDLAAAEESPLLRKPLAPAAGGTEHVGGVRFEDTSDAEYRALAAWIDHALREAP